MRKEKNNETQQTIKDFGAQWLRYKSNEGYYASLDMFNDILCGLAEAKDFQGKKVADIGSGTGRIVNMLLDAGASQVDAVEPSDAFDVLVANTHSRNDKINYHHCSGKQIPQGRSFDYILSIGVLHHIKDPALVVDASFNALRKGGKMIIWLYGYEGNELYLRFVLPIRKLTSKLPDVVLDVICKILCAILSVYARLCKYIRLPMRNYMINHYANLDWKHRSWTLFDQLNPEYSKYYKRSEAISLLVNAGFVGIDLRHRHGYSWTVLGRKP